ncbi:MAG: hypothetical protein AB4372_24465 [Xenococcus sp. (in: cyanobacteria)]
MEKLVEDLRQNILQAGSELYQNPSLSDQEELAPMLEFEDIEANIPYRTLYKIFCYSTIGTPHNTIRIYGRGLLSNSRCIEKCGKGRN